MLKSDKILQKSNQQNHKHFTYAGHYSVFITIIIIIIIIHYYLLENRLLVLDKSWAQDFPC